MYWFSSRSLNKTITAVAASLLIAGVSNASVLPVKPATSSPVIITETIPNPGVVYASLDAMTSGKSVFVKWVTASELNNSHFEVERSLDMQNFKTVALVLDGFTAEGTGKTYQFKENADELKKDKTVYYRLKQFGNDGQISYSSILTVKMQGDAAVSYMNIAPNPMGDNLNVTIRKIATGAAEVRIVTLAGQTLLSKQSTLTKDGATVLVEGLNQLPAGMYLAELLVNGKLIESQKLVK